MLEVYMPYPVGVLHTAKRLIRSVILSLYLHRLGIVRVIIRGVFDVTFLLTPDMAVLL
jgi:hypothetical protein